MRQLHWQHQHQVFYFALKPCGPGPQQACSAAALLSPCWLPASEPARNTAALSKHLQSGVSTAASPQELQTGGHAGSAVNMMLQGYEHDLERLALCALGSGRELAKAS